jgi:predicted alpha/beta-fold hydrolase
LTRNPSPFRPPWWLRGGNAQTIYAAMVLRGARARYRRERWATPDGDFVLTDWVDGPADAPLLALFHGLEGSSASHYARALMSAVRARGWRGVVPHYRGCGGEPNDLPRAYHSGDSREIDWMLRRLHSTAGSAPLFAVGVSLGGNALLKWLGEEGDAAGKIVRAAAAVSAPVDLTAAGNALGRGFNLVYARHFLGSLKRKTAEKLERFPGCVDGAAAARARTLREFDDAVTAPLHGFRDAADYWLRSSAKPLLARVRVPTLVINARDDPFLPDRHLPLPQEVSASVELEFPAAGGHVGFVTGPFPGRLGWLPTRVLGFLEAALASQSGHRMVAG